MSTTPSNFPGMHAMRRSQDGTQVRRPASLSLQAHIPVLDTHLACSHSMRVRCHVGGEQRAVQFPSRLWLGGAWLASSLLGQAQRLFQGRSNEHEGWDCICCLWWLSALNKPLQCSSSALLAPPAVLRIFGSCHWALMYIVRRICSPLGGFNHCTSIGLLRANRAW